MDSVAYRGYRKTQWNQWLTTVCSEITIGCVEMLNKINRLCLNTSVGLCGSLGTLGKSQTRTKTNTPAPRPDTHCDYRTSIQPIVSKP